MKKTIQFAIISLSLLGNFAVASNWVYVTDASKSNIYVDLDSIAPSGKYWKAWIKTEYEANQLTDTYPKKTYRSTKYLQIYDCVSKVAMIARWLAYDEDGSVAESWAEDINPKLFVERVPDTVGENISSYVCKESAKLKKIK